MGPSDIHAFPNFVKCCCFGYCDVYKSLYLVTYDSCCSHVSFYPERKKLAPQVIFIRKCFSAPSNFVSPSSLAFPCRTRAPVDSTYLREHLDQKQANERSGSGNDYCRMSVRNPRTLSDMWTWCLEMKGWELYIVLARMCETALAIKLTINVNSLPYLYLFLLQDLSRHCTEYLGYIKLLTPADKKNLDTESYALDSQWKAQFQIPAAHSC